MAIRSARSEPDLIPVGPERRRLRNLLNIWFVVIPVLVVLFDLFRRLVARLLSVEELRVIAETALSEADAGTFEMPALIYFGPVVLLVVTVVLVLVLVVVDHFWQWRTVQRFGYLFAAGVFALMVINNILVMYWVAGTNQDWFWVIVFACFLSAAAGSAIYLVINFITNETRSLADYGVGVAVFVVSTVIAFSFVLGTDTVAGVRADREADKAGVNSQMDREEELEATIPANGVRPGDEQAVQGTDGAGGENPKEATELMDTESESNDWWVLTRFFLQVAVPAVATMWMYHRFQRWRVNGREHEKELENLVNGIIHSLGTYDGPQRKKLRKKIGKRLGSKLSRSHILEYSVYLCNALGGSDQELSKAARRVDVGVSDAAVSAGVRAVFDWVDKERREWPSSTYQFLYIQVSDGIASHLYRREMDRGRRWPIMVDADVLACSRLLAILVADAIYRAQLHRSI